MTAKKEMSKDVTGNQAIILRRRDGDLRKLITRRANGTLRVQTVNSEKSQTNQQFLEASDINNIMKKYRETGQLTHLNKKQGMYLDHTQLPSDYQSAMETVLAAETAFSSLPSSLRDRFRNDPTKLLEFLADPNNREEAEKLGLINPQQSAETPMSSTGKNDDDSTTTKKPKAQKSEPAET